MRRTTCRALLLVSWLLLSCRGGAPKTNRTEAKQYTSPQQRAVASVPEKVHKEPPTITQESTVTTPVNTDQVFDFLVNQTPRKQLKPETVKRQLSWLAENLSEESNEMFLIFRQVNLTGFVREVEIVFGKEEESKKALIDKLRVRLHTDDAKAVLGKLRQRAQKTFKKPIWSRSEAVAFRIERGWELVTEDLGKGDIQLTVYQPTED